MTDGGYEDRLEGRIAELERQLDAAVRLAAGLATRYRHPTFAGLHLDAPWPELEAVRRYVAGEPPASPAASDRKSE